MKPITTTFPFPELSKLEWSHSSRATFNSCPRKFEFRKIYNNARRTESLATGAGSALHAGIQSWLQFHDHDLALWEMIKRFPIKYQKSWADANSLAGCYQTLIAMMNWEKMDEYELATFQKPDGTTVPGVEVAFVLRISNYPFYSDGRTIQIDYLGYIDLILYNKLEDEYVVWDIKTTTKDTDKAVEFRFSEQPVPYGLVLEAILGRDVNKGFEVGYWVARINHEEPKNALYAFNKTQNDLQDWMQGYLFDLDCVRRYYNLGWFARNGNSCMTWNRACTFFDFCETRNPKTIEMMLQQDEANQKEFEREEPWIIVELDYQEGM